MKRRVAVELVALNAGAHVSLAANVAHGLPPGAVNILNANHRLQEDRVGKMHLGYPNGAHHMCPEAAVGLLERPVPIRTQNAVDRRRGRLYAAATQPLTLRYVRHAVALLVHRQITHIAE